MWANEGIYVWAAEAATGKVLFLTAVERICSYNSGLFFLPDGKGLGFTPLIKSISKPFVIGHGRAEQAGRVQSRRRLRLRLQTSPAAAEEPQAGRRHFLTVMTIARSLQPLLFALFVCLAGSLRADSVRFQDQIKPLLDQKCISCHGPDKQKGGLRLDSRAAVLKGGEHGPALVPGDGQKSILLQAVRHATKDLAMPPKEKLPAKDVAAIEAWVRDGAPWPEPVAVLFEDEAEFLAALTSGNGRARLVLDDVFRGKAALGVTPLQREGVKIPGWNFEVRERPTAGQVRFMRFAWKKRGGGSVMIELARSGAWPDAKDPKGRYVAGPNTTGWAATSVGDAAPTTWTVVTVDLWKDLGNCTLTGLAPTCDKGEEALFDSVILGPDVAGLDAYAPGTGQRALKVASPTRALGDAWTDPENPVRKIWRGERLDLWSLKAPVRPAVPGAGVPSAKSAPGSKGGIGSKVSPLKTENWPLTTSSNPIDRFLLAKLAERKLTFSPEADPRTLIRRLYFDLVGLPPTPEEVQAFVRDASPRAYEQLVDKLLGSPRYGERWARHWLDVVRYADTNGHERDEFRPEMWRYRDYVVRSLNADKPYDRFIREQVAGDELLSSPPKTATEADALIATGFLRLGTYDSTASIFQEDRKQRNDLMADLVNTTGSAFLGLTFSCCNCHDHKYDPLTQADHFRFRAFFAAVKSRDDLPIDLAPEQDAIKAHNAAVDKQVAEATKAADEALSSARQKLRDERIAKLPADIQELLKTDEAKRDDATKKKLAPHLEKLKVADKDAVAALDEAGKKLHAAAAANVDTLKQQKRAFTVAMAASDGNAEPTKLFYQGDFTEPRDEVQPGFLSVLDPNPAKVNPPPSGTTGRRLALAEWIASPANPFTARVLVNRLWQHHFGAGLFANPNDLGYAGPKPTHPELLDWLATEFVARGWSVKAMHRLMVTSAAYRQVSGYESARVRASESSAVRKPSLSHPHTLAPSPAADPENKLLWRQNPRRLDAETMRDTLLAVSGKLRPHAGGKPLWPPLPDEILKAQPGVLEGLEGKDSGRRQGWYADKEDDCDVRSLYLIQKRCVPLPFLQVFDLPDTSFSCARRDVTTVAPQALNLLNSDFSQRAAKALAARVATEAGDDTGKQIERAVWLALGRAPAANERQQATAFLAKHGQTALSEFCRALLNVNEFMYVD